jgi:hypothetical protein
MVRSLVRFKLTMLEAGPGVQRVAKSLARLKTYQEPGKLFVKSTMYFYTNVFIVLIIVISLFLSKKRETVRN